MPRFIQAKNISIFINLNHVVSIEQGRAHCVAYLSDGRNIALHEHFDNEILTYDDIIPGEGQLREVTWDCSKIEDIEESDLYIRTTTIIGWKVDADTGFHKPIAIDQPSDNSFCVIKDAGGDEWVEPGSHRYNTWAQAVAAALEQARAEQAHLRAVEQKAKAAMNTEFSR